MGSREEERAIKDLLGEERLEQLEAQGFEKVELLHMWHSVRKNHDVTAPEFKDRIDLMLELELLEPYKEEIENLKEQIRTNRLMRKGVTMDVLSGEKDREIFKIFMDKFTDELEEYAFNSKTFDLYKDESEEE